MGDTSINSVNDCQQTTDGRGNGHRTDFLQPLGEAWMPTVQNWHIRVCVEPPSLVSLEGQWEQTSHPACLSFPFPSHILPGE